MHLTYRVLLFIAALMVVNYSYATGYYDRNVTYYEQKTYGTYFVDFSSGKSYRISLQKIREAIGERLPNFSPEMNMFAMRPTSSNIGYIFQVQNIANENPNVYFVIAPENLYVAGFVTRGVFYRFSDLRHITHPANIPTLDLAVDSNYQTIERIANINRIDQVISPNSLLANIRTLDAHYGAHLSSGEARAILAFATVLAEAIRFREIGGGYAAVIDNYGAFNLTPRQHDYTTNWEGLSRVIPSANFMNQRVQAGRVGFDTLAQIAAAVGIIMMCQQRATYFVDQCSSEVQYAHGIYWYKKTLMSFYDMNVYP